MRIINPDGRIRHIYQNTMVSKDQFGNISKIFGIIQDITSHKKMEEEIKNAFNYNRGLIEVSLDPLVTIGHDGKITDINAATETVTGYSRDGLIGTDFTCYFTEPEKAREGYQRVFKEGFVKDYELEIKNKNGFITPVSYNASVYIDESGEVIGVFAAARDITERKMAEKAPKTIHDNLETKVKERTNELEEAYKSLSESEGRLKIAMDLAKLVSWEYNVDSDIFTFDDQFYSVVWHDC